jgi:hypothetical protein
MKTRLFLFLLITLQISISCSSDKNNTDSISVIGQWYVYKNIENGSTLIEKEICDEYPNCKKKEYKSNGTYIFNEFGYISTYTYKIEGDFIKYYDPTTEKLIKTERIISLTNLDLGLEEIGGNGEINYYKKN